MLGSVKSQIGHTKCAAGLAGLIKTARALHPGVRPGTLHLEEPNPYWDAASSPFFFAAGARPWPAAPADRFAGVSAFGFGGTNFHAVLSGYGGAPEPAHGLADWPAELFLLRRPDDIDHLSELVAANDRAGRPWALRDLALTLATRPSASGPVWAAVVAHDLDDLSAKLDRVRTAAPGEGVFFATGGAAPARMPTRRSDRGPSGRRWLPQRRTGCSTSRRWLVRRWLARRWPGRRWPDRQWLGRRWLGRSTGRWWTGRPPPRSAPG